MSSIQSELLAPAEVADLVDDKTGATTQWLLESLQVVNWGGFEGFEKVDMDPDSTLLSGGSGTGKSTLLDAYTALMMPSYVDFNGASNSSGTGRARNAQGGRRTLLSYLRGKQGTNDDSGGASSEQLLRGTGRATWGAVAGVFVSSEGAQYSVMRLYFVPVSATADSDITIRMGLGPGAIDLRDLFDAMSTHTAAKQLSPVIPSTFTGMKPYAKPGEFFHAMYTKLAIGANGDGKMALDLLSRIQAGTPVNSVNLLYRDMVLDKPATFGHADLALSAFDEAADSLAQMVVAETKHDTLRDIREVHAKLVEARVRADALDLYGLNKPGTTKLTVWSLRKEAALLDAAADDARAQHHDADGVARQHGKHVDGLWEELEGARTDCRAKGGDELATLDVKLGARRGDLIEVKRNFEDFGEHVAVVGASVASRGDFDALLADARRFGAERETWNEKYEARRDALRDKLTPLQKKREGLEKDLEQLNKSGTRIKWELGQQRDRVAQRLGMKPTDLPFLAELIDVRPDEEGWRTAIETVLRGDASRIVIPVERRREFARTLDDLNVSRQVRLLDGTAGTSPKYPLTGAVTSDQAGRILGKLQFADHPYAGWVQEHLSGAGLNAVCVESTDELDGGGLRVSQSGQTRSGIRSSIGRDNRDDIIGFSSAGAIAQVEVELYEAERELGVLLADIAAVEEENRTHNARRDAYTAILQVRWDSVDVAGIEDAIAALEARQAEFLSSNNQLQTLLDQIEELKGRHEAALRAQAEAANKAENLHKAWLDLTDRKDRVVDHLRPLEDNDVFELTLEQSEDLDAVYASTFVADGVEDPIAAANKFNERTTLMKRQLLAQATAAQAAAAEAERSLGRTFSLYAHTWEDSNHGETATSYPDYLRILEDLEKHSLHEQRKEWQRDISRWASNHLLLLLQQMSGEVEAIKARVVPINTALERMAFGARRGRLKLKVDDVSNESVRLFRKRLRGMVKLATKQMTYEEARKAFDEISVFMDSLRGPKDPKYVGERSNRDLFLDVRRHVEVYAVEYPVGADIWPAREHRQLGSASGGESQELIAFVLGAALRFRLGDELRDRPRFRPVFLDEGFVKADSEFAGRAVSAWRELGFQIVVGAPEDKFTGLERHMRKFIVVAKDQRTGYSFIDSVEDHRGAEEAEAAVL
ncbi:ATP-binding protein [Nocardioides sp. WS12]|uniref:ATP-binding protein n=1 Tax=Nocardioides sp. WS12 TaxID=2486272 RepID=UPI0015F8C16B|nr:ATP-binding protein [Nocardioides sp. WS12]